MNDSTPLAPASTHVPGLVAITAVAFVARAGFLLLEPATQPVADELTWTNWAVLNLVSAKVGFSPLRTHMIFNAPLYVYFIGAFYSLFGSLAAVKWAQVVASSLLVPAVGRVGALSFGPRVGFLAAALTAVYPELVWFSAHFWSETVFAVLLWWSLERLLAADIARSARSALAAGLLWGLAILARETALYFTPVAAGWLTWGRTRAGGWGRAGAFLAAAVLTVAPWTLRNWVVFHAFVPVSTAGGLNLFQGNARLTRQEVYDVYDAVPGRPGVVQRIAQYEFARRAGIQAILDRQPSWLLEKLVEQMPNFWEADSLALVHIKRGAYGAVRPAAAVAAAAVILAPYLAVLGFMVFGIATLALDRGRVLLVGFLAYYNLIHVVTHGFARYRLPIMPVVFLLAASGYAAWRTGGLGRAGGGPGLGRRALAAVVALVLAACLVPSIERNLRHPAFGFADQGGPAGAEATPP